MQEKYQPSDEEMLTAEEQMTKVQAKLSAMREESSRKLKELGVDGYLELFQAANGCRIISGKINGHEVKIQGVDSGADPLGEIDGKIVLTEKELKSFLDKYKECMEEYVYSNDLKRMEKRIALEEIGILVE